MSAAAWLDDACVKRIHLGVLLLQLEGCRTFVTVAEIKCELGYDTLGESLAAAERSYCLLVRRRTSEALALTCEQRRRLDTDLKDLRENLDRLQRISLMARAG